MVKLKFTSLKLVGNDVTIENGSFLVSSEVIINNPITVGQWSMNSFGSVVYKTIQARKMVSAI